MKRARNSTTSMENAFEPIPYKHTHAALAPKLPFKVAKQLFASGITEKDWDTLMDVDHSTNLNIQAIFKRYTQNVF
jgi:hypothetical protein